MKALYQGDQGNGYTICVDIMTGKNCRQVRLLIWKSFIGQSVYPVGGGDGVKRVYEEYRYFSQLRVLFY